ncbi:PhzF family phenazine biosynthesis protein [Virgisporangium aurantiacum]|uniref:Phenazine antibiotic biosynthesis-like protein n=1 Tax=Virgisporangium aurantiacum TaxID=175570 RepID=A0A8J4E771_9ACTN|nr:PhzF family phenazine biosynthesis protein [Virgisporangium aurantiacum]GIJ63984.1 phenazine antibiotic biosynthesis-like protein [Virgisporangium aurantiacum]
MSREYAFVIADVFTQTPFGGNQLAVLPDARGISPERMQDVAREFGYSETTFVLPPDDPRHTRRVRIFTPVTELPFAGHPTVGTASVLATQGFVDPDLTMVLEEGVGPVPVDVDGTFSRFTITAALQQPADEPPRAALAAALSLSPKDIEDCWFADLGAAFCYLRLDTAGTVDRAVLDRAQWAAKVADLWSPNLYVFAGDFRDGGRVYARCFAPAVGVEEDPATGSAAAGLVASLALRSTTPDTEIHLQVDQGVAMGRPSLIDTTARTAGGRLEHVTVGGFTTVVATGTINLPDP